MNSVLTPGRLRRVPNKPKNAHRPVRFSDDDWAELGRLADEAGTDRSAVIRQLTHWWMRKKGVRLPERPERQAD